MEKSSIFIQGKGQLGEPYFISIYCANIEIHIHFEIFCPFNCTCIVLYILYHVILMDFMLIRCSTYELKIIKLNEIIDISSFNGFYVYMNNYCIDFIPFNIS